MTVTFEIRIRNLVAEFLAHALVVFDAFQSAWAITTGFFQTFLDRIHDFLIFIKSNFHPLFPPISSIQ
jgi:hypothetical protein